MDHKPRKKRNAPRRRSKNPVWFPQLADRIFDGITHVRDTRANVTQADVAEACRISTGLLSEWRNGLRGLKEGDVHDGAFVRSFVEFVYPQPVEAAERRRYTKELWEAGKFSQPWPDTLRKQLAAGSLLKYTSLNYTPVAGCHNCFFEDVFSRFFGVAGIKAVKLDTRQTFKASEYEESDVTLALFDSVDRMLHLGLKFWRIPIRMGLGAVCLQRHHAEAHSIARILAKLERNAGKRIRAIVARGEVGAIHCEKRLQLEPDDLLVIDKLNVAELKRQLLIEGQSRSARIPVVCTDEFTSLQLLSTLGHEGYLVFPMNSRRVSQDEKELPRRELPLYYCSIAIKRGDGDFYDFMQDALVQFLSTEIETTSERWFQLAKDLASKLVDLKLPVVDESDPQTCESKRWLAAWEWVFYTLSLDSLSIDSYSTSHNLPWKPILNRARQRLHGYLAAQEQKPMIASVTDLFWDDHAGSISAHGVDQLCSVLDLSLDPSARNPATVGILVDSLREALLGIRPPVDIDVLVVDPLDVSKPSAQRGTRAMIRFMRSLQNMYSLKEQPECDAAVGILQNRISSLEDGTTWFAGSSGRLLLARVTGEHDFIGGACLELHGSERCEVSYLWVVPHYRDRRIGERIIERALVVAASLGANVIYAKILKDVLASATSLFERVGFTRRETLESGRTVFERPVEFNAAEGAAQL